MRAAWDDGTRPTPRDPRRGDLPRIIGRGVAISAICVLHLVATLALRPVERLRHGAGRPWTTWITMRACRAALACLGLTVRVTGTPDPGALALVANHASWLDVFVLNARTRVVFVAKSEVAGWAGIGWLARAGGTVFIRRDAREAGRQRGVLEDRLAAGQTLAIFPEGTSTDGRRVLPFRTSLFSAFSGRAGRIQPVSVVYHAPQGLDARIYGWWGGMGFAPHMLRMLSMRHGSVDVVYHASLATDDRDRKALARRAEAAVRQGCADRL